jgi:(S)-citramalyl-CoA lyase
MIDPGPQLRTCSWLFTPATHPARFSKAAAAGADVAIIDLEDSVAPPDKAKARTDALAFLAGAPPPGAAYALRLNAIDTPAGISDLDAVLASPANPHFLVLPKVESAGHLQIVDRLLSAAGKRTRMIAQVETARALACLDKIATSTSRLDGIMLGAADMSADLGCSLDWEALAFARSRIVAACALANIQAIDTPYFQIGDEAGLRKETASAAAFGFSAKAAIHPSQIAPINAAFSPTDEDIEKARAVLDESRKGAGTVDGLMIDEAMARRARRVLAAAGLIE